MFATVAKELYLQVKIEAEREAQEEKKLVPKPPGDKVTIGEGGKDKKPVKKGGCC